MEGISAASSKEGRGRGRGGGGSIKQLEVESMDSFVVGFGEASDESFTGFN